MDEKQLLALVDKYQQRSDTPDSEMIRELVVIVCKLGGAEGLGEYLRRDHSQEA